MNKECKVATIIDRDNIRYTTDILKAMDFLQMAVNDISYGNNIDEATNKPLNVNLIKHLENIIYELEDCVDIPLVKVYKKKHVSNKPNNLI